MCGQQLQTAIVEKEGPEGSSRKYDLCLLIGAFIPQKNIDQGSIVIDDGSCSSACIFSLIHSFFHKNPILGVIS
jgi:hypothetical protein